MSTIVIGATNIASYVYVLKRPQLTGSQKVGVLLAPMVSEIPVGFLIFVPLTAVGLILFWDQGTSDQLAFLYVAAPMACLLNLLPVFLGSRLH